MPDLRRLGAASIALAGAAFSVAAVAKPSTAAATQSQSFSLSSYAAPRPLAKAELFTLEPYRTQTTGPSTAAVGGGHPGLADDPSRWQLGSSVKYALNDRLTFGTLPSYGRAGGANAPSAGIGLQIEFAYHFNDKNNNPADGR